ncbi:ABC transporter substrate-binding protein [Sinomonas terrae]|uniref:Extracellular solute-binding protein n=1 Tax=Sinomonas terrae TaxID=2908838 RepID=A0ABS9TYJ9_9MICC|nr:extracellular solute-binding protein [Sinomonas terrae]MCH6469501.1 extracellular solute-binding protein [Sinomonas terrae]
MTREVSRRSILAAIPLAAFSASVLAACGNGGSSSAGASASPVSQSDIDAAMKKASNLTFWTWVPNIQKEVDMFQAAYPAIKVEVVNVGQGAPHYQKLRAAIQAGKGAPDVVQMEFDKLPSFTLTDSLLDLTPYGIGGLKSDYPAWVWDGITPGGKGIYGVPQDTGPMGMLYREDLFSAAGLSVPKTWDDFATAATSYRGKSGSGLLTNWAPSSEANMLALFWQAGGRPFAYDGAKTVTINLSGDAACKKVTSYWNDLFKSGNIGNEPDFVDAWYQALNSGKYASWLTGAWGPVFLQGTAKSTAGKWRAAPLPQWDATSVSSGNYGGSTDAVLKSSQNPIAAAMLAKFINTDDKSALTLANEQFLFPSSTKILADPAFANATSSFYGGQKVNQEFTDISKTVKEGFQFLPFNDYAATSYDKTMGQAIGNRSDLNAALTAWQDDLVQYAKGQGFTIAS